MAKIQRTRIYIEGLVQGIGFRPFCARLARDNYLCGYIANCLSGVKIEVEGTSHAVNSFLQGIKKDSPPGAFIESIRRTDLSPKGYVGFSIQTSLQQGISATLVNPDMATCPDCLKELFDPHDHRHLYPFINCTNCGPRFSILKRLPYDRENTTMSAFRMCPRCLNEFNDMSSRRFHAQPNACPSCGPKVELVYRNNKGLFKRAARETDALYHTVKLLEKGAIVAIKGIGGFHIACDAFNNTSVKRLRAWKNRPFKPLAIMSADTAHLRGICRVDAMEREILLGNQRPIVLLKKATNNRSLELLSPASNYLGVMLAYAPVHHLLFSRQLSSSIKLLVMTSGNSSDEPIAADNESALNRLGICDYFLLNDRPIQNRLDDSIVQVFNDRPMVLRRARGYVPYPVNIRLHKRKIFAAGADLKNSFCLAGEHGAFVSQYAGDLGSYPNLEYYRENVLRFKELFHFKQSITASDSHPDYFSSAFARQQQGRKVSVQHHAAHLASVMAEHALKGPVIGICLDGTGWGDDGTVWGGEVFTGNRSGFTRAGRLQRMLMPGADICVRESWRMALSCLYLVYGEKLFKLNIPFLKKNSDSLKQIYPFMSRFTLQTSSAGRLFDAASSLLGFCDNSTYEAQAAQELQWGAEQSACKGGYQFGISFQDGLYVIGIEEMIRAMVEDIRSGANRNTAARKFHNGLAAALARLAVLLKKDTSAGTLVFSGGVFQNRLFSSLLLKLLQGSGFTVYYNQAVPVNDGGVCLGQAFLASAAGK